MTDAAPGRRFSRATGSRAPAAASSRSPSPSCRLAALWVLAWATLDIGYWLALPLAIAAAGFLVRLFMIQHDCGHGAFFRHRLANDWFGRVARRADASRPTTSGATPMPCITPAPAISIAAAWATSIRSPSSEYRARSFWGRLRYRLYRHPLVMFGLGPAYLFILQHRLPVGLMRDGWRPWAQHHGDQSGDRARSPPC